MRFILFSLFTFLCSILSLAQSYLPTDYLSPDFHRGRREAFRQMMPPNSVAAIFAYAPKTFSNDVQYVFHQNPDLYYLSGYKETDAVLFIFKDTQIDDKGSYNELFFVRKRDPKRETWEGIRLGPEGVKNKLGFSHVYNGSEFYEFPIDFSKFDVIIHDEIPVDIPDDGSGYDVYGLLESFQIKASLSYNREQIKLNNIHKSLKRFLSAENLEYYQKYLKKITLVNEAVRQDTIVQSILKGPAPESLKSLKDEIKVQQKGIDWFKDITRTLREIKTPEELVLLRKAVDMSCIAHNEVIKSASPEMSENKAHGIHLYVHKHYGSEDEGYAPIVGAGANGCILHYDANIRQKLNNDLLLMDVGAEYHGYTADVTRTFPATGTFSTEQRAIYEIVYAAQEAVFDICKEGTPYVALNQTAKDVIASGLLKLGIIQNYGEVSTYYPHGCSHYLGLDVHDKGMYGSLKAHSVITVEPGIYIPPGSPCDSKWWNIGVRIEDDILILENGYENLSASSPRTWQAIEKLAKEKGEFNKIKLPPLK